MQGLGTHVLSIQPHEVKDRNVLLYPVSTITGKGTTIGFCSLTGMGSGSPTANHLVGTNHDLFAAESDVTGVFAKMVCGRGGVSLGFRDRLNFAAFKFFLSLTPRARRNPLHYYFTIWYISGGAYFNQCRVVIADTDPLFQVIADPLVSVAAVRAEVRAGLGDLPFASAGFLRGFQM